MFQICSRLSLGGKSGTGCSFSIEAPLESALWWTSEVEEEPGGGGPEFRGDLAALHFVTRKGSLKRLRNFPVVL